MDAAIGKFKFPLWGIIASAVGGAVLLALALYLTWRCCCRRGHRRPSAGSVTPTGGASSYTYSPGSGGYPTPGSNGAWGYHHQQQQQQAQGSPYTANGYFANGYAQTAPGSRAPSAPPVVEDPIEQQRIALAMAASRREQQQGQRPAKTTAEAISEPQQLRLAMDASLQEQRRQQSGGARHDDDAQLRAAIEASLQEQQRQQRAWGGAGASGGSHWG